MLISSTTRLFIALDLPSVAKDSLSRQQQVLRSLCPPQSVTWVNPDSIHITLKFLGMVASAHIQAIEAALSNAVEGYMQLPLEARGLGCFPHTTRPKVIWAGLSSAVDLLQSLRDSVEAQIAPLGYPTEDRPFAPHLTLGRVKSTRQEEIAQIGQHVVKNQVHTIVEWQGQTVTLMKSELKAAGAVYTPLVSFELADPSWFFNGIER